MLYNTAIQHITRAAALLTRFFCPKNFVCIDFVLTFAVEITTRDGAEVARQAHNLEVVGSNPAPATKNDAFLN